MVWKLEIAEPGVCSRPRKTLCNSVKPIGGLRKSTMLFSNVTLCLIQIGPMRFIRIVLSLFLFLALPPMAIAEQKPVRILAMGDSLMAWHNITGQSIAHSVSKNLNEPVINHAIGGARILYGLPISGAMGMKIANQYRKGDWDWVVLNGGGNDIWFGCGCQPCEQKMNRMISEDGKSGAIPKLVSKITKNGAKVVYVGYLRSPGVGSIIDACRDEGDEFEARIEEMAKRNKNVHFLSIAKMVPHGDRSYHGIDMIHPSVKASTEIGRRVAAIIRKHD